MSDQEEYFENDNVMKIRQPVKEYKTEKDFTSLKAWQKAREVKLFFFKNILPKLPKEDKFSLNTQIRKACISTTANIAEGYGRYHYQESMQFYRISRGSLYELKDHLISCFDFDYIDETTVKEGQNLIETAKITLNGYINYIERKK
jgi:four helix bundle protein